MTEIDLHDSDCATHNEPAYPNGPCDCSLAAHPAPEQVAEAQDAAVGGLLSAAGVDDLCERLDDVLVEESPMHPFGCATWTEASHIAIDMAKDFIRQSGARAERAEAERDALRKALEPFSTVLADIGDDADDVDIYRAMTFQYRRAPAINVGHLRKARAALAMQGEGS